MASCGYPDWWRGKKPRIERKKQVPFMFSCRFPSDIVAPINTRKGLIIVPGPFTIIRRKTFHEFSQVYLQWWRRSWRHRMRKAMIFLTWRGCMDVNPLIQGTYTERPCPVVMLSTLYFLSQYHYSQCVEEETVYKSHWSRIDFGRERCFLRRSQVRQEEYSINEPFSGIQTIHHSETITKTQADVVGM